VIPAGVFGAWVRISCIARPWPSSRWCTAAIAALPDWTPGACLPLAYPANAEHHGSFSVSHPATRSPSLLTTVDAYSANRYAVSRLAHPPFSSSDWGRSQW
jgi:hypothetical protein